MNRKKNLQSLSKDMAGIPLITIGYSNCIPFVKMQSVTSADDAHRILRPYFELQGIETYECMYALFLSQANRVKGVALISMGSINNTMCSVHKVCQMALMSHSTTVVLSHNHPSGNLIASDPDKNLTRKVKDALKLVECTLLDHIIITQEGYYSFANDGAL